MELAGQKSPSTPTLPDVKTRLLRIRLITEELIETARDLGFNMCFNDEKSGFATNEHLSLNNINFVSNGKESLIGVIDGLCDISVTTYGTFIALGVDDVEVIKEVDENNLLKFKIPNCPNHGDMKHVSNGRYMCDECSAEGEGGYRDENGKWKKSRNHPKPEIAKAIGLE